MSNPDIRDTIAVIERAAIVAFMGLSVGALAGLVVGFRLGRRAR